MAAQPLYRYERLKPGYARLWAAMRVVKTTQAIAQAKHIIANKARYKTVQGEARVPWFVVGCLHMREASGRFTGWLHNGDPMRRNGVPARTVHVPAHRPPDPAVDWEKGAYDALVTCEGLNEFGSWCPELVAYAAEKFNGFGYRNPKRNIPSPYLWGGTSVQKPGKFTSDRVYDRTEMDPQLGVMAVLKIIMQIDPEARFEDAAPAPQPQQDPAPEPQPDDQNNSPVDDGDDSAPLSPKAHDTETQFNSGWIARSRTMWGNLVGTVTSIGASFAAFWEKLDNPYTLAAFIALLLVACFAAWLVFSGRVNVQKVVEHLAADDTEPEHV